MSKKTITVMTPCYNEEGNVEKLFGEVREVFKEKLPEYDFEHIFVDNCSEDNTVRVLRQMGEVDPRVKVIVNARNFGVIRSGFYGMTQCHGDATVVLAADLQEPPAVIPDLVREWEKGYHIVKAIKTRSKTNPITHFLRGVYYGLIQRLSDVKLDSHFTGFGLYDKRVIDEMAKIRDNYPYLRGIISEIGFESTKVEFVQQKRHAGRTSYNLYELYDTAMLGITSHSKIPLRIATISGFIMSILTSLVAFGYLIAKLVFWDRFPLGMAPIIISVFGLASLQMFFIGILGEYIGLMHMRILKRPLVVEKERVNF